MSDLSSFLIHNPRLIIHNLSILVKNKCLFGVRFGEGAAFFLTAILEIDQEKKVIIFDYGPKEELNKQLLKARKIMFEADVSGIKASFKGSALTEVLYQGGAAFSMPIPASIYWQQRREFFRITSPRSKGSYCQLILKGQSPVNIPVHDISLTGFSLLDSSAELSSILIKGAQFEKCKLVLAETGEDIIDFKVCARFVFNPDKIASLKIYKVGCLFTRITPAFESVVQRYINQLQRESIQKMSES